VQANGNTPVDLAIVAVKSSSTVAAAHDCDAILPESGGLVRNQLLPTSQFFLLDV
jgi:hypothetical protein